MKVNQQNFYVMHHFLLTWNFPTQEDNWAAGSAFAEYIKSGGPADCFEGFELKYRLCDPIAGNGVAVIYADHISKVWKHAAPWIAGFGVEVDVQTMLSDLEFLAAQPEVYEVAEPASDD